MYPPAAMALNRFLGHIWPVARTCVDRLRSSELVVDFMKGPASSPSVEVQAGRTPILALCRDHQATLHFLLGAMAKPESM